MGNERKNGTDKIGISQERQGKVRSWSEMQGVLEPFELSPRDLKLARGYF